MIIAWVFYKFLLFLVWQSIKWFLIKAWITLFWRLNKWFVFKAWIVIFFGGWTSCILMVCDNEFMWLYINSTSCIYIYIYIYRVWMKYYKFFIFCRFFLILWKCDYIVNRLNMICLVEKKNTQILKKIKK